jgi:hypothetical protein
VLRAEAATFSGVLEWYSHHSYAGYDSKSSPTSTSPASDVHNSSVLAQEWVSVAAQGENVTAMCLTNSESNTLSVRFYKLQWDNDTEILALEAQSAGKLVIPGKWKVDQNQENPWIRFCTLATPREASHLLVACVQQIPNRELTPFILRVCVGDRLAPENSSMASCAEHDLPLPEGEMPSFISTSFLRQDKMNASLLWVVGVKGEIYGVTSSTTSPTSTVSVYRLMKSDLQFKHFVRVDHMFVTFSVSIATAPSVLTYLPNFGRWNLKNIARVPTAYAVLLVPREVTEMENVVTFMNSQNILETSQARRNITIRRASYIVQKNGEPALPVYERTGLAVVGNETTELRMSTHTVSPSPPGPSSFLARYSQTIGSPDAASGTLNRALGIPFALGRYEQRDEKCVFTEWQMGKSVTPSSPESEKLRASVSCGSMGFVVGSTTKNDGICPMCKSSSKVSSGFISGRTSVDGVNEYSAPIHCYWLVAAEPNVEIQVQFTDLHVNPSVPVKVYECADASCASCAYCGLECSTPSCSKEIELSQQYEVGLNLKENHVFASKTGYLKIAFTVRSQNDLFIYDGFSLDWTLRRLPSNTTLAIDPALCVNDQYEGYVVSGASCNQESEIEGLYTYDAAASSYYTNGKPVYARRTDINYSSPFTNPLKRYLYYHRDYGWLIGYSTVWTPPSLGNCDIDAVSGDLRSHDHRCGNVRAALQGKGHSQFPPVNVFWSEWCKVPGAADYTPFNSLIGARALQYKKIYQNLTLSIVPRCVAELIQTPPTTPQPQTAPVPCVEDPYEGYVISGAGCDAESSVNGLYTYFNWRDPNVVRESGILEGFSQDELTEIDANTKPVWSSSHFPVYAKREGTSYSSDFTHPLKRYLYYHKGYGWLISAKLGWAPIDTYKFCDTDDPHSGPSNPWMCGVIKVGFQVDSKGYSNVPQNLQAHEWCKLANAARYYPSGDLGDNLGTTYQYYERKLGMVRLAKTPSARCPAAPTTTPPTTTPPPTPPPTTPPQTQPTETTPVPCVEDHYIVSGATCQDESNTNGLYSYFNWTDPNVVSQSGETVLTNTQKKNIPLYTENKRLFAKKTGDQSSAFLHPVKRYLYFFKAYGWMISAEMVWAWDTTGTHSCLTNNLSPYLSSDCGFVKTVIKTHGMTPETSSESYEWCRHSQSILSSVNTPRLGQMYTSYTRILNSNIKITPAGSCPATQTTASPPALSSELPPQRRLLQTLPPAGPAEGLVLDFNASRWKSLREDEPWLLLQFTVPCGRRLRPYKRSGTACGLADVAGLGPSSHLEPDCPPQEHVVVLLDATRERETTVYHMRQNGSIASLVSEACDCIFMQTGVFWVDATIFRDRPSELDIRSWLVIPAQKATSVQPAPLVDTWRRERHVLQVMPRERMRLELLLMQGPVSVSTTCSSRRCFRASRR